MHAHLIMPFYLTSVAHMLSNNVLDATDLLAIYTIYKCVLIDWCIKVASLKSSENIQKEYKINHH